VQYDHAKLEIELIDGGKPYDISNATRVEFTHVRSDNLVIIQPGEIVNFNGNYLVTYDYQGNEMDLLGTVLTSFAVFNENERKVSSPIFEVTIVKDLRNDVFSPAEPTAGFLQSLIDDVERIKETGGVVGPQGIPGERGKDGYTPVKGVDYFDGINGKDGLNGKDGKSFTYADFTQAQLEALRGPTGLDGKNGTNGINGVDGKSAYQVAVSNGYVGTEAQWIMSLKGDKGEPGSTANIAAHQTNEAPHQYGNKFEWRFNATTNSLDLVVLP